MVGELPSGPAEGVAAEPSAGSYPTPYLQQSGSLPRPWLAPAEAVTAAVAPCALVVALIRPTASRPVATKMAPIFSSAESAAAQKTLCDTYKMVARAVEVDTSGNDKPLARIADTNGAVMLDMSSSAPAPWATARLPATRSIKLPSATSS